jgi:hypothetical protein
MGAAADETGKRPTTNNAAITTPTIEMLRFFISLPPHI